jgi:O-antigen/teichoic acid export membrane protein
MYFSNLIPLTYSPQILIFLTQRYLGIDATALFGFLCKLYLQIVNYLPATLLFSLIQPKLVASYIHAGNMSELIRNANLAGKLSLFVLMPLVTSVWLVGDELLHLLSDGKFVLSGNYMTGLMLAMIPLSQRRILETVAVTIDKNHIILISGFLGIFSLPIAYGLIQAGYGIWGPVAAMVVSQIFFNAVIIIFLVYNTDYRPDSIGFLKLVAAALSVFILAQIPFTQNGGWLSMIVMVICVTCFFLLAAYFLKPFKSEERDRLNRFFKKKLFVW